MIQILIAILFLLLSGCGATSSVRINVSTTEKVNFKYVDERPMEERASRVEESRFSKNSFYGDENLMPSPSDLFRAYMASNAGEALSGKTVKLTTFLVSAADPHVSIDGNNFQNAARSVPNANPLGVALAAPLILGIESIKSQKMVSVSIRGTVDEREFSSFCSGDFRGRVTEDNVRTVMLTCLERVAAEIKGNYPKTSDD